MESENAVELAESKDDELVKLAQSKATDLVIGFFYIYQGEFGQWIKEIKAKFKDFNKKALIILCPLVEDDTTDYTDWYGLVKESSDWDLYYIKEPWNKQLKLEKKGLT